MGRVRVRVKVRVRVRVRARVRVWVRVWGTVHVCVGGRVWVGVKLGRGRW